MTFVCSLAQRFLFGERSRRITAWPHRAGLARLRPSDYDDLTFFGIETE
jgi:hypothetical protein